MAGHCGATYSGSHYKLGTSDARGIRMDVTANTNDLMNASKGAANVGGDIPGVFAGAASLFGTAAAANMGGLMGPANTALSASMGASLGKLGSAVNDHSAQLERAATTFQQNQDAQIAAQKPVTDSIASAGSALDRAV
jgi:hypothetical protein